MKSIGTVVLNKKENNLQMIISYYPTNKGDGKRYDYLACMYPLGFSTDLPVYFLNKEDFDLVIHEGLETVDFDNFTTALENYLENKSRNQNNEEEIDMSQFIEL